MSTESDSKTSRAERQERSSLHGILREFHLSANWAIYKSRLSAYFDANKVKEKEDKRAIFINLLSEEAYSLLQDLSSPDIPEKVDYEGLIELFDKHFCIQKGSFSQRYKFYNAKREPKEAANEWLARLRHLSIGCQFESVFQAILLDRFVIGFEDKEVMQRLFEEDPQSLTLEKAVSIANAVMAKRERFTGDSEEVNYVKRPPRRQGSDEYCSVCGRVNHSSRNCKYKNLNCRICGEKGHLAVTCMKGRKPRDDHGATKEGRDTR